jgi:hypothetical protein
MRKIIGNERYTMANNANATDLGTRGHLNVCACYHLTIKFFLQPLETLDLEMTVFVKHNY